MTAFTEHPAQSRLSTYIKQNKKITVEFSELRQMLFEREDYQTIVLSVNDLIASGLLEPVKASGSNGMHPSLPRRYRIRITGRDRKDEINSLHPCFRILQYLEHPDKYEKYRDIILPLSEYLYQHDKELKSDDPIESNERTLLIWDDEKFLSGYKRNNRSRLQTVLTDNALGEAEDFLAMFYSAEQFSHFIVRKTEKGKALIIENRATYNSLKRLCRQQVPLAYDAVIFGHGGTARGEHHIDEFLQDLYDNTGVRIVECEYFGDLDRTGIAIMQSVIAGNDIPIVPAKSMYRELVRYGKEKQYPIREKQRDAYSPESLGLTEEETNFIRTMIDNECFLPQEVFNKNRMKNFFLSGRLSL